MSDTHSYFTILTTSYGGRGAFASRSIPTTTTILTAPTPAAYVVFRKYRNECCAQCFKYDNGRKWKMNACSNAVYFCSEDCKAVWLEHEGNIGVRAWTAVEDWLKRAKSSPEEADGEPPDEEAIDRAWKDAENAVRQHAQRRHKVDGAGLSPASVPAADLHFFLSGVLTAHRNPSLFARAMQLARVSRPYRSPDALKGHTSAFVVLSTLSAMPPELKVSGALSAAHFRALAAADVHNSFGMWSEHGGDGGEMLGYGMYPEASLFNHSCAPLVNKETRGRSWVFSTQRDVQAGEELTISYIGRDELVEWDVVQRREVLHKVWDFVCACPRCTEEGGEAMQI